MPAANATMALLQIKWRLVFSAGFDDIFCFRSLCYQFDWGDTQDAREEIYVPYVVLGDVNGRVFR